MKTFIIIMIAVLWAGLKAYKGVRKTFAEPEATATENSSLNIFHR